MLTTPGRPWLTHTIRRRHDVGNTSILGDLPAASTDYFPTRHFAKRFGVSHRTAQRFLRRAQVWGAKPIGPSTFPRWREDQVIAALEEAAEAEG